MKTIHVTASREYDVLVGPGLLEETGERMAGVIPLCTAAIVSDDNVFPLYGERVKQSLERAGYRVVSFVFPHGESAKDLATYGALLGFLSQNKLTRSDALVALGGGVTGDLTGFAAATYQRGIPFVQLPTTLLSAVDSSVGGKTGVNLPAGKNQVGAFYQPSLVLCDTDTLRTLPGEEYRSGCAEVIKYAVLWDAPLFRALGETPVSAQAEAVIAACVAMKRDVVAEDEFDRGNRQLLNLGHSIGHAVETCNGYAVLHGEGVAMGMAAICRAAAAFGICSGGTADEVAGLLSAYGLPTEVPYSAAALCEAMLLDKKVSGGSINLVVPEAVGRCRLERVPTGDLTAWLKAGGIS